MTGISYNDIGGAFDPLPDPDDTSVSFSNGTLLPYSVGTITVNVTAPEGTYPNDTGHLFIGEEDTGSFGSATLTASSAPPCTPGLTLATFQMGTTDLPPVFTSKAANVSTATASFATANHKIDTAQGNPVNSWSGEGFPKSTPPGSTTSPYFDITVDTSKYEDVSITVQTYRDADWSDTNTTMYVWSSSDGGASFTATSPATGTLPKTTWSADQTFAAAATGSSTTIFRINAYGANNPNSEMNLDNIVVRGCGIAPPPPTIAKSFSPETITQGDTSTLTFTITNTTLGNVALTGIAFTDVLPVGLTVASGTSSQCGGTLTTTAPRTIAFSGGSLSAGGSCSFSVSVTGATAGQYENVSDYISCNEGGTNTSSSGYATDTLTVNEPVYPPVLSKWFSPSSVLLTGSSTSTLNFMITNPNKATTLHNISFTDTLPAGVTVVTSPVPTSACSGSWSTTAPDSISFSGGQLAPDTSCYFSVTVYPTTTGTKNNTTSVVTSDEGSGSAASATLQVNAGVSLLALNKQISTTGLTGPWTKWVGFANATFPKDVYYRFFVSNDGETDLHSISVTDDRYTLSCTWPNPFTLTPGSTAECTYGPVSVVSAPSSPYVNTASATSTETPDAVTSSAEYGLKHITIIKDSEEGAFSASGDVLHYHYKISNDGHYPLLGPVTVSDNKVTTVTCDDVTTAIETATGNPGNGDKYLDPGESVYAASAEPHHVVSEAELTAGFVTNEASATIDGVTSNIATKTVYYSNNPLHVFLSGFRAYAENARVIVFWETAGERNTLGFQLLRLDPKTGGFNPVNAGLLPALAQPHRGGIYRLRDDGASPGGTYTYQLVEVETDGKRMTYGPITVCVGVANGDEPAMSGSSAYDRRVRDDARAEMKAVQAAKVESLANENMATGDLIKITVSEKGLYFMDACDIASLLEIPLSEIAPMIQKGKLSLSSQGEQIAYLPAPNDTGLYFYGAGVDSLYTQDNVYWLERGEGRLMSEIHGMKPRPSTQEASFSETRHFEENLVTMGSQYEDEDYDQWLWGYLFASSSWQDPPLDFTFEVPSLSEAQTLATIRLQLQGGSDAGVANDHHVALRLNGQPLAEDWWSGLTCHTVESAAPLKEGENTLTVEAKSEGSVAYNSFFINYFDVTYKRLYEAQGGCLFFRGDGNRTVTLRGFSSKDVLIFDLTDPLQPRLHGATTIRQNKTGYTASLYPATADTPYVAVTQDGIQRVYGKAVGTFTLSSQGTGADYLIIAPARLLPAAQTLADYRAGQGYKTRVVDVESVMNEFGFGLWDPEAIRSFLSFAHANWSTAPRFAVLIGDGSMDYKDYLGFGGCLIPSPMMPTPHGRFVSDNHLADFDGDHVPEIAIGRLPVTTADELLAVVGKIQQYERTAANGNVVLLADTPDRHAGNFITDSETLASLFPVNYALTKIYLSNPADVGTARSRLFAAINSGVDFFNYIGHSNAYLFSNSWLLYYLPELGYNDLPRFRNAGRLPIMTVSGCSVGDFSNPYRIILAEALLFWPFGGIAAVWTSTGFSDDVPGALLSRDFYNAYLQSGPNAAIGDVVRRALSAYKNRGKDLYMIDVYNLIGDPALRLR